MFIIYDPDTARRRAIVQVLSRFYDDALEASTWEVMQDWTMISGCWVVTVEWLERGRDFLLLRSLKAYQPPYHPTVLITQRDPANLRHLKDVTVEEVVWIDAIEEELPDACERLAAAEFRARLGDMIRQADSITPLLKTAIIHVLFVILPVTSVARLAANVGVDVERLRGSWPGSSTDDPFGKFLAATLLLRAVELRLGGRDWDETALLLDIPSSDLAGAFRRFLGCDQDVAVGLGVLEVARRTLDPLLRPLFGDAIKEAFALETHRGA